MAEEIVYELECKGCGHFYMDNHLWKKCSICGNDYEIIRKYPAGE